MLASYVWRDLVRNPRRSLAALAGIALGVGLFSAVLFFIDGSSASMTQRAVAPLPIDMQRVLTAPLGGRLHLTESVERIRPDRARTAGHGAPRARQRHRQRGQRGGRCARSHRAGLAYVPGSATVHGAPVAGGDAENPFARGGAKTGLNVGTVPPGATVTASLRGRGGRPRCPANDGLEFQTSFSSREVVSPVRANAPEPLGLQELAGQIAGIDGVAAADQLSFVDLPAGALSAGPATAARERAAVRLRRRLRAAARRHPISWTARSSPGDALISVEAAPGSWAPPWGTRSRSRFPARAAPLPLTVSGEADLRRARSLFFSRQGGNLEDFLYTPNSVVIDPAMFQEAVIPALLTESATRGSSRNLPVREVDVQIARDRLDADPGTALVQTQRIADDVTAIAPEQDYLVDNISNTLASPARTPAWPSGCSSSSAFPAPCWRRSSPVLRRRPRQRAAPGAGHPAGPGRQPLVTWSGCWPCAASCSPRPGR